MTQPKGFTLLELLLSVSLLGILTALVLPVGLRMNEKNDLDVAVTMAAMALRRAQTLSQSGLHDGSWGVFMQTGLITLFKGPSYAGRDASFDETSSISSSLAPSGLTEIVFSKGSGGPQNTGILVLTGLSDSARITINSKGILQYE